MSPFVSSWLVAAIGMTADEHFLTQFSDSNTLPTSYIPPVSNLYLQISRGAQQKRTGLVAL